MKKTKNNKALLNLINAMEPYVEQAETRKKERVEDERINMNVQAKTRAHMKKFYEELDKD